MKEKRLRIVYDSRCAFCIRVLKFVLALDWLKRLELYAAGDEQKLKSFLSVPASQYDFENAMYAFDQENRGYRGFFAFRRICREIPMGWFFFPLCYLPGVSALGQKIYTWVAKNRKKFGCEGTICKL